MIGPVGEANAKLAEYSGLLEALGNPALLVSPLVNEEAVLSSRIEGTQATISDVHEYDSGPAGPTQAKTDDLQEIANVFSSVGSVSPSTEGRLQRIRQHSRGRAYPFEQSDSIEFLICHTWAKAWAKKVQISRDKRDKAFSQVGRTGKIIHELAILGGP